MSNNRKTSKEQKNGNDRLESSTSSDAIFNSDSFSRNISSFNNIQNILRMYTKEIQAEKNREASATSFKRSENLLRGPEGISEDIYINSLANLSDIIHSEIEENVKRENQKGENPSLLEEDLNTYDYDDNNENLNQKFQEQLNNLELEQEEYLANLNLENYTDSKKDSQEINSSILNHSYPNDIQQNIIYNSQGSEKNSHEYPIYNIHEYENEQLKQNKNYDQNNHRNSEYDKYPEDYFKYKKQSNSEVDYVFNNYGKSLNENMVIETINNETNSEYTIDPFSKTRNFLSKEIAFSPRNNKYNNSNYASINIGNILNKENEVQLNYSTATYESTHKNELNSSNGIYDNSINDKNSFEYENKNESNYQSMVNFMRDRSIHSSLQSRSDINRNKKSEKSSKDSFELKTAISLKCALEKNSKCEKNEKSTKRYQSDSYAINNSNRKDTLITKPKSYSLEDMKNGKIEIPKTIFTPLAFNVPGNNIIDSYEKNKKLEKFMNDCNNSTNLILKYPQIEKKKPIKTINIPVHMSSIINNNIGIPIIYEDDFDREQYHPYVNNLHVGSIFEKHVFNMLKNKKDLGKQIYSESEKFKKYNYNKENGFWISNISKDRIKNPEKNNSYITELVYEKDKTYNEEMNILKNCTNYKELVPSVYNLYKNNNFYKFLYNQNLCPRYLNPDISTIMRRYDVEKISTHKTILEIPGMVPYIKDMNNNN